MAYTSGAHDRRGFDMFMKLALAGIVLGLTMLLTALALGVGHWMVGLAVFMISCSTFITLEKVSAPPENSPVNFTRWARRRVGSRKPVLVCLGDSLTHGNASATLTPEIAPRVRKALGMPPPGELDIFSDPLWVVNCGQNHITSHTILHERLSSALGCYPDFILLWIGTNDVRAIYNKSWSKQVVRINDLPQAPTLDGFERNLVRILDFIRQSSPNVQVGICTLPPMGEDLKAQSNQVVREANAIIERVTKADGEKTSLIPVFERLEAILEKKRRSWRTPSVHFQGLVTLLIFPIYHLTNMFSWNTLSSIFAFEVMNDGLHLNETGVDEVADLVTEWLMKKNVAKAIAVKS